MTGIQRPELGRNATGAGDDTAAAVRWLHLLLDQNVSNLSPSELAEWAEWSEDPARVEKVCTVHRVWGSLQTVATESTSRPTEAEAAVDEYDGDGDESISEWLARGSQPRKRWRPNRGWMLLATAACVLAVTFAFILYGDPSRSPIGDQVHSYVTAPSERLNVDLSDGSRIMIGARTELTVHYTAKRRFIFLDHGEASFTVAHSAMRPFQVLPAAALSPLSERSSMCAGKLIPPLTTVSTSS